jgi:hypothetical protein
LPEGAENDQKPSFINAGVLSHLNWYLQNVKQKCSPPHHDKEANGQNVQMVGGYFVLLIDTVHRKHSFYTVTLTNLKDLKIILFWILYIQKSDYRHVVHLILYSNICRNPHGRKLADSRAS